MCGQPRPRTFYGGHWRLIFALGEYEVSRSRFEVTDLGRLVLAGKRA
jgi:hypothetical protein